ncbi:MAG: hypothetical protein ABIH34_04990, partial [Nanoarchaeota archaeon]
MKKTLLISLIIVGLLAIGMVAAFGHSKGSRFETMEKFMNGDYEDIEQYRDDSGYDFMPWVHSQEDLEIVQAHHAVMSEWHGAMGDEKAGCNAGCMKEGWHGLVDSSGRVCYT